MMKKTIISLLLVLSLIGMTGVTSLAAVPGAVDIYEDYMCLYKTFENDNITQELENGNIVPSAPSAEIAPVVGANGSSRAARITISEDSADVGFKMKLIPEVKYRISAWVRLDGISLKYNTFNFIYHCTTETGRNGYYPFTFRDADLKTDEWVHISKEITLPKMIYVVQSDDQAVDTGAVGLIGLRLGSGGELSNIESGGNKHVFSIDDFIVEPIYSEPIVEDKITFGEYDWSSDCPKKTRWYAHEGAQYVPPEYVAGYSHRLEFTPNDTKAGYINLYKNIASLWHNKAYKIGVWARADFAEGAIPGTVGIVVYNNKGQKIDERIQKWPTISSGEKITAKWKYYEWIYFQGLNTFDERIDGRVDFRVHISNGTGSQVYMSDMNIQPLDMPYQGAVNYGTIDKSEAISNAGWYFADETKLEKDASFDTAYRMVNTNDSLKQHVQIKDNKTYKITFKAKAESYVDKNGATVNIGTDAASVPVFAVLDRGGNTKYIGDWNANAGSAESPSYDYQYISGATLSKEDAWSAEQAANNANWNLTNEWQEFSGVYNWDYRGESYRMPLLGFSVGDPENPMTATWSIADVKVEEISGIASEVKNVKLEGEVAPGSKIGVSYDFIPGEDVEGISYVRVLGSVNGTDWSTLDLVKAADFHDYTIPEAWAGKQLKLEVLPVESDGKAGAAQSVYAGTVTQTVFSVIPYLNNWNGDSITGECTITASGIAKPVNLRLYIATYKGENADVLSSVKSLPVTVTDGMNTTEYIDITDSEATAAKLFVLKDNSFAAVTPHQTVTK